MPLHVFAPRAASRCHAGLLTPVLRTSTGHAQTLLVLALLCCGLLHAQAGPPPSPAGQAPLLPQAFAGLHQAAPASAQAGASAALLDPAHSALLREDGLLDAAQATYSSDGPALTVRAYRFVDATGAYAAFTAYREPQMRREALGIEGCSLANRYLFWAGATLVEAAFTKADPHALAELNALAQGLPKPRGSAAVPPPVRRYLPAAGLETQSVHYAIGPAGYALTGATLPESVIDFSRDAEVLVAHYRIGSGVGTLTLLNYPTPQIAANRQKAIAALLTSGAPQFPVGDPALVAEPIGPLVAFTSGRLSADQAHALIRAVHYDEILTINHPEGYVSEVSKAAKLLLGIAYMTGILALAAVLLALFLGGGRLMVRRMRGLPDSSMNDDDFISLKLR